jgi:hypothetical protein
MRVWWSVGIVALGCGGDGGGSTIDLPEPASEDGYVIRLWDDTSSQCSDPAGAPTPLGGNLNLVVEPGDAQLDVHACFAGAVEPCTFAPFDARRWLTGLTLFETAPDRFTVTHAFTANLAGTDCAVESETITLDISGEVLVLRWRRSPQVIEPVTCETTRTDVPEADDAAPCVLSHHVEAIGRAN